jgi:hypothetical protein
MIAPLQWNPEERHVARKSVDLAVSVLDLAEAALGVRVEHEPAPTELRVGRTLVPDLTSILNSITLAKYQLERVSDNLQPEGDVEWLRKQGWEV